MKDLIIQAVRDEVRAATGPPNAARLAVDLGLILASAPVPLGREFAASIADTCMAYIEATNPPETPGTETKGE